MSLFEKLLEMQKRVDGIIKDGKNLSDRYDFASDENVLDTFRPMMDEYGLLLIPKVTGHQLHTGETKSGTTRYMTEIDMEMIWHDVESGEEYSVSYYCQGVDLAGEKGVGKAYTYGEKYFLLKFFHVPTKKDDPDAGTRTASGEIPQRGTAAAKENIAMFRKAIPQMITEMCADEDARKKAYVWATANKSRGYAGVDNIDSIKDAALAVVYGKLKPEYEKRTGKAFALKTEDEQ